MEKNFNVGDLVWAKMKGFSYWPARIVTPGVKAPRPPKQGCLWVYFFGSNNYGWVEKSSIKPYDQYKEKYSKATAVKKAIENIEEYILKKVNNPSYELNLPPERINEKSTTPKDTSDSKFNKLVSQKNTPTKRATPVKRQNSYVGSSGRNSATSDLTPSTSKRSRLSGARTEENGISNVGTELLNMPVVTSAPETQSVNLAECSDIMTTRDIQPSTSVFGFLGTGVIGQEIIKNLINSNHKVNLYSRTLTKCEQIKEQAEDRNPGMVKIYETPWELMQNSDIIFSCVPDPRTAKENVTGNCGIAFREDDILVNKGYVEMTSLDPQTSKDICEIIEKRGGRYLEAQIQGSKKEAHEATLVVLAAGDKTLFNDCQSCFKAMGNAAIYLGGVGYATKTNLALQLMKGIALAGLAEGLALADRCGISYKDLLQIFKMSNLNCEYLSGKAELIVKKEFKHVEQAVQHMQKDMKLALDLSDHLKQPLLMTSTANEVYKHTRRLGYDGYDASCVYLRIRH